MNKVHYEAAQKLFEKQLEPAPTMTYAKEQQAAFENYERLKALRLQREAAAHT